MSDETTVDGPPRWIEYLSLDDLVPDPRNPKGHDDGLLDSSLRRFELAESPMVDERTGVLVAGHGRREMLLRARAAHAENPDEHPVPEGVVVGADGAWTVPVQRGWASANDAEAFAYLVTSNKSAETGGWLQEELTAGLDALAMTEQGLEGTGFTAAQLEKMKDDLSPPAGFTRVGEDIATEHTCPKCGYEFSGKGA